MSAAVFVPVPVFRPNVFHARAARPVLDQMRDRLGDAGFIAYCEGRALLAELEYHAGVYNCVFHRLLARHVRACNDFGHHTARQEYPDPRESLSDFVPYSRHHAGETMTRANCWCYACGRLPSGGTCSCE